MMAHTAQSMSGIDISFPQPRQSIRKIPLKIIKTKDKKGQLPTCKTE
jgi:hypothetical protein